MWPDRVSNAGPLTLESDALSTALRGSAIYRYRIMQYTSYIEFLMRCIYTVHPNKSLSDPDDTSEILGVRKILFHKQTEFRAT